MLASIPSATLLGVDGHPVTVEVHVAVGLPSFTIVGLPDTACRESRDRVRAAIYVGQSAGRTQRITINLVLRSPQGRRRARPRHRRRAARRHPSLACRSGRRPRFRRRARPRRHHTSGPWRAVLGRRSHLQRGGRCSERPSRSDVGVPVQGALRVDARRAVRCAHRRAAVAPVAAVARSDAAFCLARSRRRAWDSLLPGSPSKLPRPAITTCCSWGRPARARRCWRRLPGLLPALDSDLALEATRVHSAAGVGRADALLQRPPFRAHTTACRACRWWAEGATPSAPAK